MALWELHNSPTLVCRPDSCRDISPCMFISGTLGIVTENNNVGDDTRFPLSCISFGQSWQRYRHQVSPQQKWRRNECSPDWSTKTHRLGGRPWMYCELIAAVSSDTAIIAHWAQFQTVLVCWTVGEALFAPVKDMWTEKQLWRQSPESLISPVMTGTREDA